MIEFDDRDLRDLQEADGVLLQDVHGQRVAIGKGFDYGNFFVFMNAYFDEYGAKDFAKKVGYEDAIDMFKSWFSGIPLYESDLMDWVYESFAGIDADSLTDQYDHENEEKLEAEDHKLDQERGKQVFTKDKAIPNSWGENVDLQTPEPSGEMFSPQSVNTPNDGAKEI